MKLKISIYIPVICSRSRRATSGVRTA